MRLTLSRYLAQGNIEPEDVAVSRQLEKRRDGSGQILGDLW